MNPAPTTRLEPSSLVEQGDKGIHDSTVPQRTIEFAKGTKPYRSCAETSVGFRRNPVAPMPRGEGQLSHPMQSSGWTAGTSVRFCTNRAMPPDAPYDSGERLTGRAYP